MLESLFNKLAGLQDLQTPTQCVLENLAVFLRIAFYRTPPVVAFVDVKH